jgi:hypothetical protein
MNSSSTNETALIWETLMIQFGSTWLLDNLYLYFITSIGFVGFFLNALSLVTLIGIRKRQAVYIYFQMFTLNGILFCLVVMGSFYMRTPRIFDFALSYGAGVYRCKIYNTAFTFGFFGRLINTCILLERISVFKPKLIIFVRKPFLILFICFSISIVFSLPLFFLYEVRSASEFKEALTSLEKARNFPYCRRAEFSATVLGRIVLLAITVFRDLIWLIVEVLATVFSVILLNKFIKKKQEILGSSANSTNIVKPSTCDNSSAVLKPNRIEESNTKQSINRKFGSQNQYLNIFNQTQSFTQTNKNISKISICFAFISIITNFIALANSITFVLTSNGMLFHQLSFLNIFAGISKNILNFFLFYFFNKNFRNFISKIIF